MSAGAWLEVVEPKHSAGHCARHGHDSLFLGMRIALDHREALRIGRLPHDELQCGRAPSSQNSGIVRLAREGRRWRARTHGRATSVGGATSLNGGLLLDDGIVIDNGPVAFRFRDAACDPLLGPAWRVDRFVLFPAPFLGARFFRAFAVDDKRPCTAYVAAPRQQVFESIGELASWRGSRVCISEHDWHGPTLQHVLARSAAAGGTVDAAFLNAVCFALGAERPVRRLSDVAVRFDGTALAAYAFQDYRGPPPALLHEILREHDCAASLAPSAERMTPDEVAGVVRALFPEEAAADDAVREEVPLLDADGWRARVPPVAWTTLPVLEEAR